MICRTTKLNSQFDLMGSSSKHSLDGFKVTITVLRHRLETAALGPLVPGIDGDNLRLRRRGQQPLLNDLQGLLERGRCVARDHRIHDVRGRMTPIGVGRRARTVVPIDRRSEHRRSLQDLLLARRNQCYK